MSETKHEKFVRLAESRTNKIIDTMRLLGNCANKSNYDYDEYEVRQIINSLDKELKLLKSRFEQSDDSDNVRFTLKSKE